MPVWLAKIQALIAEAQANLPALEADAQEALTFLESMLNLFPPAYSGPIVSKIEEIKALIPH